MAAQLKPIYEEINKDKKKLEVIVLHGDRSETAFQKSFPEDVPWVALPFESTKNAEISSKYSEGYVPQLYVLNFEGTKVMDGNETRKALDSGAAACFDQWNDAASA